jgi:hypothetical protein
MAPLSASLVRFCLLLTGCPLAACLTGCGRPPVNETRIGNYSFREPRGWRRSTEQHNDTGDGATLKALKNGVQVTLSLLFVPPQDQYAPVTTATLAEAARGLARANTMIDQATGSKCTMLVSRPASFRGMPGYETEWQEKDGQDIQETHTMAWIEGQNEYEMTLTMSCRGGDLSPARVAPDERLFQQTLANLH